MTSISELLKAIQDDMPDVKIDPEFSALLDPLSPAELEHLETSIVADGVRDGIVLWDEENMVIDGHNRLSICKKHNITPPFIRKSFKNRDDVKEWMIRNQLARRNLTKDRFTYYVGTLYNAMKSTGKAEPGKTTAETIAEQVGVTEKTVRRAAEVAKGIDAIEKVKGPAAKQEVLAGKSDMTQPELSQLGKVPEKQQGAYLDALAKIKEQQKANNNNSYPAPAPVKSQTKTPAKAPAKAPAPARKAYDVALVQPEFDGKDVRKPLMKDDSVIYMMVNDGDLANAINLIAAWGYDFECTFIFPDDTGDKGAFSKIGHRFLVMGTKGIVAGPKKGQEQPSIQKINNTVVSTMVNVIDKLHPGVSKLDTRKGRPPSGWDGQE